MTRLIWGATGSHTFELGVDKGVLYSPKTVVGVPWNGLISVNENPKGGDPEPYYLDGVKYLQIAKSEEFDATIEAFTVPEEFNDCDGTRSIHPGLFITQQPRKQFGFSYRSLIGNDVNAEEHGYKIHIVYNALAKPSSRNNKTLSDNVDPLTLSWSVTTVPPSITGFKPSSHIVINSLTASEEHLAAIEDILYGAEGLNAGQPTIDDLITIFGS